MKRFTFISSWIIAGFFALTLIMAGSATIAPSALAAGEVFTYQVGDNIGTMTKGPNGSLLVSSTNTKTGVRTTTTSSSSGTKTVVKDANGNVLSTNCNGPNGNPMPCP